jgi:cytochrome b561
LLDLATGARAIPPRKKKRRPGIIALLPESFRRNADFVSRKPNGKKMTENIYAGEWRRAKPQSKAGRFDQISIALHWLTVILVATQFTTAWLSDHTANYQAMLLSTHRSMGMLTWITVAARLVWRHGFAYLPPFPASMPTLQQRIAKLNEYALYAVLLVQPVTGLGNTLFHGRRFALLGLTVPALFTPDKAVSHVFESLHALGAWALVALIGLHAAAALLHWLILRDGVFQRMLPWTAR